MKKSLIRQLKSEDWVIVGAGAAILLLALLFPRWMPAMPKDLSSAGNWMSAGAMFLFLLVLSASTALGFEALDTSGQWFDLSALRGRFVVLEWVNPHCPPWRAYYDPPFLQPMQQKYPDVAWVWICTRKGVTPGQVNALARQLDAHPTRIVLDPSGRIAREFQAKCTPHVFVLDREQKIIYQGAVDDGDQVNYLGEALDQARAGLPIQRPVTQPFGCTVFY